MECKESPLVSIVVCTYNRKGKLERCLDSIFELSYPKNKFEVIVVDGGSTDSTTELMKKKFGMVKFLIEKKRVFLMLGILEFVMQREK